MKTHRNYLLAALLALGVAGVPAAHAATTPPDLMTYQGFLVDGNGNALATNNPANYPVIFRVYPAATGNSGLLWSEQQIVTVDKGNFSVVLGEGTPVGGEVKPALSTVFAGNTASDRYMSISVTIGGSTLEILPRLRLMPSPYAFLASSAVNLVQPNGSTVVNYANNRLEVAGNLFSSGTIQGTFSGNGSGLTDLNASQLTAGALPDARLSANVARRDVANTFLQSQTINGALGIGTSPGARLDVLSSTGSRLRVFEFGGGSGSQLVGGWAANSPLGPQVRYERVGAAGFWDEGMVNGDFVVEESDVRRLTLRAGGNVGIANDTPASLLHLGNFGTIGDAFIRIESVGGNQFANGIKLRNFNDQYGFDLINEERNGTGIQANGFHIIRHDASAAGVSAFFINKFGGNIGVGTTAPADQFHLRGGALRLDDGGSEYIRLYRSANGLIITGNGMGNPGQAGGFGTIQWDGDGNWDSLSDRRLKQDIVDAEPVLDRLMQLPVRRYRWKGDDDDTSPKFGVIAQEVKPLFPESVGSMTPPGETNEMFTVKYASFGLLAVKALQELKAEKDTERASFRKEIADLKAEVELLKGKVAKTARVEALEQQLDDVKQIMQRLIASQKSTKTVSIEAGESPLTLPHPKRSAAVASGTTAP